MNHRRPAVRAGARRVAVLQIRQQGAVKVILSLHELTPFLQCQHSLDPLHDFTMRRLCSEFETKSLSLECERRALNEQLFHLIENVGQLSLEDRQILLDNFPDKGCIRLKITVHENMSHSDHPAPCDFGMRGAKTFR